MRQLEVHLYGKVQGVWFRGAAQTEALQLGLTGYAKNEDDGSVTLLAEGKEEALEKFLKWASHGPEGSRVDNMNTQWAEATGHYSSFTIR